MEAYHGWPKNKLKTELRWTRDCNGGSDRTKLHFLATGEAFVFGTFYMH